MSLPVELIAAGKRTRAISQDLSLGGMFVRLSPPLPVGTEVQLGIAPNGQRFVIAGQVIHSLGEVEASSLGRFPGIGVMFHGTDPGDGRAAAPGAAGPGPGGPAHARPEHSPELLAAALQRLIDHHAASQLGADLRIVVADPQTRVLERLSTALHGAGFSVATATNGMEAIGACLSRTPNVVLVERDMPVVDGLHVLQEMGRHAELANVPVMMMSADATDLVRLQAFQLGAMDFIPKPFTVLEVILRARRWARAGQRDSQRILLRGTLGELALPSLLTMFEQDRKTGQLTITRDHFVAWLDLADGKIVRARSSEIDGDSHAVLMSVLDWSDGYFELAAAAGGASADLGVHEIGSVTHLLLEHARLRDEAQR